MTRNGPGHLFPALLKGRPALWLNLALLVALCLSLGGCWLWEDPPADRPPLPTTTPRHVEEAGQSSPSISGRLLYASAGHIWLRSGTTARRLTTKTTGTQPCWSPDGQQIVFVVRDAYSSDLWIMDADGGNAHPITSHRSTEPPHSHAAVHRSYWAAQPQWIPPEGLWIGYVSHSAPWSLSSVLSVWLIPHGGGERRLYRELGRHIENPSWSPDGTMLAFTLFTYDQGAQLRYEDEARTIYRLGSEVEGVQRYDPAWSPDGHWIAYAARQGEAGTTDLWLMPSPQNPLFADEWEPIRLTNQGAARGPAWSPNGLQIAFVAGENGGFNLWLLDMDFDGPIPQMGKTSRLTNEGNLDATARPCWAP